MIMELTHILRLLVLSHLHADLKPGLHILIAIEQAPGGGLGIPTDRNQRNWVFLNNPKIHSH